MEIEPGRAAVGVGGDKSRWKSVIGLESEHSPSSDRPIEKFLIWSPPLGRLWLTELQFHVVLSQLLTASEHQCSSSLPTKDPSVSEATPTWNHFDRQCQRPTRILTSQFGPTCVLDFISSFPDREDSVFLVYPESIQTSRVIKESDSWRPLQAKFYE